MRISYITGLSSAFTGRDGMGAIPKKYTFNGFIGDCGCGCQGTGSCGKKIGTLDYASLPSYHKAPFKVEFESGLDWYRVREQQDKGKKALTTSEKASWSLKAGNPLKIAFRKIIVEFIEANGGGVADSMYNALFRQIETYTNVGKELIKKRDAELSQLTKTLDQYAPTDPLKLLNTNQRAYYIKLVTGTTSTSLATSSLNPQDFIISSGTNTAQGTIPFNEKAMNLAYGSTAWKSVIDKNKADRKQKTDVILNKYNPTIAKNRLSVVGDKVKAAKEFRKLELKWFNMGGNPSRLLKAIIEGNTKQPRGKAANYMMMKAKKSGLKLKDLGLVLRGIISGFLGDKFNWGDTGTAIYGNKKGIGEAVATATTSATITANIKSILGIITAIGSLIALFKTGEEKDAAQQEINNYLENGYITQEDFLALPLPRPSVADTKYVQVPEVEVDIAGLVDMYNAVANKTPEGEKVSKEAKVDKSTSDYLKQIEELGQKVPAKKGYTTITLVKLSNPGQLDKGDGDDSIVKFGGAVIPLLIGAAGVLALATFNKQKK